MTKTSSDVIEMNVTGLTIDPFTSMPIIILKDSEERYSLPIWIGLIEASAIATELEKIQLSRPMTHDLLKTMLDTSGVKVVSVSITDLSDNTFYSEVLLRHEDREWSVDARPSDAIAIAMRTKAHILVHRNVIDKSRKVDLSKASANDAEERKRKWTEILENLSPEDFGKYKM